MDFTNNRMESHMCFICPECGQEHTSQQNWRNHLNEAHNYSNKTCTDFDFKEINESFHECQVCHKWVANAHEAIALLQYHRFMHLPYSRTYRCKHCTGAFTRKRALVEHLMRYHSRLIARLEKMQQSKSAIQEIKTKSPQMNAEFYLRFLCPQCGVQYGTFDQWQEHINTSHHVTSTELRMHPIAGTQNHYCLQCRKLFYTSDKATLQRHRFSHLPYKLFFKCAYCSAKKNFKAEILRHFIFGHKKEFAENRTFITIPVEWGGSVPERLHKELSDLLAKEPSKVVTAKPSTTSKSTEKKKSCKPSATCTSSDLIKKALLNSLIDLEKEAADDDEVISNYNKQPNVCSLDNSINDLKTLIHDDQNKQKRVSLLKSSYKNNKGIDKNELEKLCTFMFDEIEKDDQTTGKNIIVHDHVKTDVKEEYADSVVKPAEQYEEVISIEIDAVSEKDEPPRKCLKLNSSPPALNNSSITTSSSSENLQLQLNSYILYVCPQCGSEFADHTQWRNHVFSAHDLANAVQKHFKVLENKCSYLCLDCKRIQYTDKHSELLRHLFLHMPYTDYVKCTICKATISSKPKIEKHLREMHAAQLERNQPYTDVTARQLQCSECHRNFLTATQLQNHRTKCMLVLNRPKVFFNVADNVKLLAHLRKAQVRIRRIAETLKISNDNNT